MFTSFSRFALRSAMLGVIALVSSVGAFAQANSACQNNQNGTPAFMFIGNSLYECPPGTLLWTSGTVTAGSIGDTQLTPNSTIGITAGRVCHARYSFSVDGGAVATITPASNCTIPNNALVVRVLVVNTVAPIGSTGNVSVGLSAGGSGVAALLAATARGSLTVGSIFEGVPVGATASSANTTAFKMTAAGNVTVTVSTNALTAGVMDVFVYYSLIS